MTRLENYANGEPLGVGYRFENVVDSATESAPGEPVFFAIEDDRFGILRFRLTPDQARAAALGLLVGADTSGSRTQRD
ncbi:hypothetical protein [Mycolicibacterium neworleansense]|uniref:Uncharacterized protein n=1 Tax=Mycolicibacterium neworleansense TaxID=146018 RepID=A0A0H5S9G1_9MYCO|nr:hypothetical protein [Mycolicibacterium neworleansense]MCV7365481.1 hypothetical protein [Mycolicibacterium neworleansense]CRZ17979.1 hypothetical protein BN2156_04876 [Mycolicibacterium neworleansense]